MPSSRVGVIGDKDSVLAFKAVGVEVFDCIDGEQARHLVRQLTEEHFAVIFITEPLAQAIPEVIAKAKAKAYPAIVPIPTADGSNGYGMQGIKKDVEKAIGTDILFNQEG